MSGQEYTVLVKYFHINSEDGSQSYEETSRNFGSKMEADSFARAFWKDGSKIVVSMQMFRSFMRLGQKCVEIIGNATGSMNKNKYI